MEPRTAICCFCATPATRRSTFACRRRQTNAVWQIVFDTARWRANDLGKRLAAGETCVVVVSLAACCLADGDAPLSVRSFSLQT